MLDYFCSVVKGGIHTSCHEKRHLDVFGWVGFLARPFIRGYLTFFEIPNKSFVLYAFISKNRHEQDSKEIFLLCIFFPSCFAILQLYVSFQYSIFLYSQYLENVCIQRSPSLVLRKCLHTTLSVAGKKSDIYTKDAHE